MQQRLLSYVQRAVGAVRERLAADTLSVRHWVIIGAVLAITGTVVLFQAISPMAESQTAKPKGPPPMRVGVDSVIREPVNQTVPVIGRVVARLTAIAARINGPIDEVRVDVGDRVEAGDVIAMLVKDTLKWKHALQKAEVQQYAAAVKTRKAKLRLQRQQLKRIEGLKKSAAFSKARLEDKRQEVAVAENEATEAEAKLASAEANLKLTEINLSYATIRAPFPGVVSKRMIEVGVYVNVGDPMVVLIDNRYAEIEAAVPANRTAGLTASRPLTAFIDGNRKITVRVRAVVPDENPQTRTRLVRFVPEPPQGLAGLASNQSVTLHLPAGNDGNVVTVHKDAILNRKGKNLVYLAEDNKAAIRAVHLGEAVGTRFVVLGGLAPGDLVVVRGNERLQPGQKIRFKAPDGAKSSSPQGKVKG
jgi:RND family efflux transporter MFP subunit